MSNGSCTVCQSTNAFRCSDKLGRLISSYCQSCYEKRECKDIKKIETYCSRCGKCDLLIDRVIGTVLTHNCWICDEKYKQGF